MVTAILVASAAARATAADDASAAQEPEPPPRKRAPEDPDAAAVRQAAGAFLNAAAEGEERKARERFAGEKPDVVALEALMKSVAAARRFRTAIEGKLSAEPDWTKVGADAQLRRSAEGVASRFGTRVELDKSAGTATLGSSQPLDAGLRLKRVGADWKVVAATAAADAPSIDAFQKRLAAEAAAFTKTADAIEAGNFERWDDAMRALAGEFEPPKDETILEPEDPRGAALRMTARDFLTALADNDADRANTLFAGDDDQRDVLEAYFAAIESGVRLRKALAAAFGERKELSGGGGVEGEVRATLRLVPMKVMSLGPGAGSMSPGIDFDRGLEFKRVGGRWLVSSLTPLGEDARAELLTLLRGTTKVLNDVTAELDAGRPKEFDAVMESLRERMEPLLAGGR